MKIYAGSSRKSFNFAEAEKYVGKDIWVAVECGSFDPKDYMMYVHFINLDNDMVIYNGVDTPTLEGMELGYKDKDFYERLLARFNGEGPNRMSKEAFSRAFNQIHKPIDVFTTEELLDLLSRCEVEE